MSSTGVGRKHPVTMCKASLSASYCIMKNVQSIMKKNDEYLILHSKMIKYIHLACSEAFDIQLQDCWPLKLVDSVP